MRLVRIDGLAPGGRGLELHPRLTVLVGAPPEVRARLAALVRAIVDGGELDADGVVEVHGVRVELDRIVLDRLGVRAPVDPFLDLDAPSLQRPARRAADGRDRPGRRRSEPGPTVELETTMAPIEVPTAQPAAPPPATPPPFEVGRTPAAPHDPARLTREVAERDLQELRAELRSITGERTVLARRTDEARGDLDSFARATLEVAVGQLEALEARLAAAADEAAGWATAVGERRAAAVLRVDELRSELRRLEAVDPPAVTVAAERLAALLDPPTEPDPAALVLASELEDLVASVQDLDDRRAATQGLLAGAEQRLAAAVEEARAAQDAYRSPSADPQVVVELERVRDEIYELEERGGRIAVARSKRRIDELRATEAELLDRLGFDTYSSYVMGVPTARAEAERALQLDVVRSRVDQLREEVDQLRAEAPGGSEDQDHDAERRRIVEEAAALVGTPADALARLTSAELCDLLRARVLPPPPETSAEILSAAGRLAATMSASGAPSPTAAMAPRAMLVMATDWLEQVGRREDRLAGLREEIEAAERELRTLDGEAERADDGGRTADLEAEILVVRDRIADGEERVARHQLAMAELAELRAQELELRDREREVEDRIGNRERLLSVLGPDAGAAAPAAPPPIVPPPFPSAPPLTTPPPSGAALTPDEVDGTAIAPVPAAPEAAPDQPEVAPDDEPAVVWPVDREWRLLARLGDVRDVGRVGALPLVVTGVSAGSPDTEALLHRIHGMSELVQLVVVADDERVVGWAAGLGEDAAAVVRW